jgi:hypothetical protein
MSPGARKEMRGGDIPNLPVPGGGTILVYLQGGEYSRKAEIVGTSGSYSQVTIQMSTSVRRSVRTRKQTATTGSSCSLRCLDSLADT